MFLFVCTDDFPSVLLCAMTNVLLAPIVEALAPCIMYLIDLLSLSHPECNPATIRWLNVTQVGLQVPVPFGQVDQWWACFSKRKGKISWFERAFNPYLSLCSRSTTGSDMPSKLLGDSYHPHPFRRTPHRPGRFLSISSNPTVKIRSCLFVRGG